MKVILSPAARDYIKSEIAYLKVRSPRAALQFSEDLERFRFKRNRWNRSIYLFFTHYPTQNRCALLLEMR